MVGIRRIIPIVGVALVALLAAFPASAQTIQHVGVYFDVDNDAATGCDAQGFSGAEVHLTVTMEVVNTPSPAAQVTAVEVAECADPGTDTFGPGAPVSGNGTPPWPVGVGLGVDGSDVIEAYVSRGAFPDAAGTVRAGVVSGQGEPPADTMYVTLGGGSEPILIPLSHVISIPTLSEWMLLALALLLATSAFLVLRRRPARMAFVVAFLVLALSAGGAGVAWAACVMDGMIGDWTGASALAQDPTADASGQNPDLRAFFAKEDGSVVCLRIDAFIAFNDPPVANDDVFATDEDTPLNVPAPGVLTNDSDPDTDPVTVTGFDATSTQGAAVTVNADGSFTYDPTGAAALQALAGGATLDDTFTYTIGDGNGGTDTATVTVTVSGVNDAPSAMSDSYETDEDVDLVIPAPGVLVNDSDPDTGDTLAAVLDTDVSDGTLTLNGDGSFTYDPDLNFNGTDSFTYHANDGTADSATVTVTLTVGAVNDGPNAVDDSFATDEDTPLNVAAPGVLTNDTDPEGDSLTVVSHDATSAQGAAVTVNADGSFTYDPTGAAALQALAVGATVDDTFTYTIEDPSGIDPDTATVTVEVTGVDDPPTAVDDAATVTEDDPATTLDVQANDDDPDGGSNTISGVTQPANGDVVITNAGADLTYQPDPDYCNDGVTTDDFTYTLSPGGDTATVAVTVICVNDPPVADDEVVSAACNIEQVVEANAGETAEATAPVFRTVTDNVLIGDSDPVEGTAIEIIQASGAPGGTSDGTPPFEITTNLGGDLTLHDDGSFVYTPEGGDRGVADSFTYTIEDADGGTDTATVTLNVAPTCIWFVDNSVSTFDDVGTGTSSDPFTSLVDELGPDALPDDAEDASQPGDVIYVLEGDSNTGDPYLGGFVAEANERLLGQGVDLVVDLGSGPETLFTDDPVAGPPLVENQAVGGDAVQVTDVAGVEVAGLQLAADGNALQVTSAAAPVGIDFHDNEIAGSGDEAILISQTVNDDSDVRLANNTVSATGNGIDASLTAGSLSLVIDGHTGIVSDGTGMDLDGTGGDLYVTSFCGNTVSGDTLGTGIFADGVIFDASPLPGGDADFTGDEVGCTTATSVGSVANPVGGSAMVLNGVSGDLAFGDLDLFADGADAAGLAVTGTGLLNAGAGTGFELTTTSGTISAADGPAVDADQATAGLVFDSVTSAGSSTEGISLADVAGSFQVTGTTSVSTAAGDGIAVVDSSADVTLSGQVTVNGAGSEGIFLDDLTGDFSAPATTSSITNTTGDAFSSQSSEGNITYAGTITNATANSVDVRNHGGGAAATILFSGNIDDTGAGIFLDNNDQGAGSTVSFTGGLDLDTGTNTAFNATNGGTVNVTSGGVSTTADTTTGTVVNIINSLIGASGVTFDSTSSTGGADGINLTSAGSGAFTSLGGSLANQTDRGVDVSGGSGDVRVDATISTTTTGRSVEVTTHTGGTVDFNGAINDNGLGIQLANNVGAVLRFDGGMDVDTAAGSGTEEGFQATGGGTLHVTGTNDVDTSLATGTAVNIANVTIGADGVTFRTVAATGGTTPGLIVNDTGTSGFFTVSGTAGDCEASAANCSGGGITSRGADGIQLTDAQNVSLNFMNVASNADNGLVATRVNGFEIIQSRFTDNADAAAPDEAGLHFIDSTGTALAGSHPTRLEDVRVENSHEHDVIVRNDSGTLAELAVISSQFLNDGGSGQAANRFFVDTAGTANVTVDVSDSVFRGNQTAGALTAFGFVGDAAGTSDQDLEVTGSDFDLHSVGLSASVSGGGDITFNFATNTVDDSVGNGINFFANSSHTGILSGTVSGNTVGTLNDTASGSDSGSGIRASNEGNGTMTLLIDNNTVQEVADFEGIIVTHALLGTTTGATNATVTNNTIRETDFDRGLVAQILSDGTLCADIAGNTFSNIGGTTDMRVRITAGTFNVEQDEPTGANVATELDDANGGASVTVTETSGSINFGAANCSTP